MTTATRGGITQGRWFSVRSSFLVALSVCVAAPVVAVYLSYVISPSHNLKMAVWALASGAVLTGWFFLFNDHTPNDTLRTWIAVATSIYLTASLPTFLFEISPFRWFAFNPMHREFSMYVSPWIYGGFHGLFLVLAGVAGSFFGRGRARIAFLISSVLLLILWAATMPWVH